MLLAQMFGWNVEHIALEIVIIAAVIALVYVALRKFNVQIPDFVVQCFLILVVALVVCGAIKLLFSMA